VRARNEWKKIKESEGHIVKRTKFLVLKKELSPASQDRPLVELAPRGTTCPAPPVGEFGKSGKNDEL
jgi:hypothetical protein